MERFRATLGLRHGPLYRALNLTPDQIEKFEAAETEWQQGLADIWTAASDHGIASGLETASGTSVARMTANPNAVMQDTLKAVLGEEGFRRYKQFEKTLSARDFVTKLAGNVYYSETPLSGPQGEALVELLGVNTKSVNIPMADDGNNPMFLTRFVTDWSGVVSQAERLHSPGQLAALRSLAEEAKSDSELKEILNPRPPAKPTGE